MCPLIRIVLIGVLTLLEPHLANAAVTQLGEGAWIDDDNKSIVVGASGYPLTSYRLTDGTRLWRHGINAHPILILDDHIVAFENAQKPGRLRLLTLTRSHGKRVARDVSMLPDGVLASAATGASSRFELQAHPRFPRSRLVWAFTPSQQAADGVRALPQSGVLSIDAMTARAGALDETPPPRKARAARLERSFAGSSAPAFFSADRQHVIVVNRQDNGAGYEWALYDRDTRLLGRINAQVAYTPFVVRGDIIVTWRASAGSWRANKGSAATLLARDWRSGEVQWEQVLTLTKAR